MDEQVQKAEQRFQMYVQPLIDYMNGENPGGNKKGWANWLFNCLACSTRSPARRIRNGRDGWPTAIFKVDACLPRTNFTVKIDYVVSATPDTFHASIENLGHATWRGFHYVHVYGRSGFHCSKSATFNTVADFYHDFTLNALLRHLGINYDRDEHINKMLDFHEALPHIPDKPEGPVSRSHRKRHPEAPTALGPS